MRIEISGWKHGYCYKYNKKCFLSSKSEYQNDLWRSCDTEDWSDDAENTAARQE